MDESRRLPLEIVERMPDWLLRYKDVKVMYYGEDILVFRSPNREDARELTEGYKYNAVEAEHRYLDGLILYPEDYDFDNMFDAEFTEILTTLWTSTIFGDPDKFLDTLETRRKECQTSADKVVEAFICAAFGQTPDYVDKLNEKQLIDHIVLAEQMLGREVPLQSRKRLPKVDPNDAMAMWVHQRMVKREQKRRGMWEDQASVPDVPEVDPENESSDDGIVNTEKDNRDLFRIMPEAARHASRAHPE